MGEMYFTCPVCKTPNFTRKGLRAHCCKTKGKKENYLGREQAMPLTKEEWLAVVDAKAIRHKAMFAASIAQQREGVKFPEQDGPAAPQEDAGRMPTSTGRMPALPTELVSSRGTRELTLSGLDVLPPVYAAGESQDVIMGRQLTEQWDRVVGGQREQLIFGAMMLKLRAHLLSPRADSKHKGSGRYAKGEGVEAWLAAHAKRVSKGTAYRLMDIAEGVAAEFKLGKRVDLEMLLSAQVENLDTNLAKKRAKIEECIEGRSQRQLLLEFGKKADGRASNKGGFRPNGLMLRGWLEQEYPENPEYHGAEFFELPEEVQKRFRKEGERYEQYLTKEQRAELEHAEFSRQWYPQAVHLLGEGIDADPMAPRTDEELETLNGLLNDLRAKVNAHQAARKKR